MIFVVTINGREKIAIEHWLGGLEKDRRSRMKHIHLGDQGNVSAGMKLLSELSSRVGINRDRIEGIVIYGCAGLPIRTDSALAHKLSSSWRIGDVYLVESAHYREVGDVCAPNPGGVLSSTVHPVSDEVVRLNRWKAPPAIQNVELWVEPKGNRLLHSIVIPPISVSETEMEVLGSKVTIRGGTLAVHSESVAFSSDKVININPRKDLAMPKKVSYRRALWNLMRQCRSAVVVDMESYGLFRATAIARLSGRTVFVRVATDQCGDKNALEGGPGSRGEQLELLLRALRVMDPVLEQFKSRSPSELFTRDLIARRAVSTNVELQTDEIIDVVRSLVDGGRIPIDAFIDLCLAIDAENLAPDVNWLEDLCKVLSRPIRRQLAQDVEHVNWREWWNAVRIERAVSGNAVLPLETKREEFFSDSDLQAASLDAEGGRCMETQDWVAPDESALDEFGFVEQADRKLLRLLKGVNRS